jgi:hypothetical protein
MAVSVRLPFFMCVTALIMPIWLFDPRFHSRFLNVILSPVVVLLPHKESALQHVGETAGRYDLGNTAATALLGGLGGNALTALGLFVLLLRLATDHASLTFKRDNARHTAFDRLLNDRIHLIAFGKCLI